LAAMIVVLFMGLPVAFVFWWLELSATGCWQERIRRS